MSRRKKRFGKHTSQHKTVKHVIRKLDDNPAIGKVILGRFHPFKHQESDGTIVVEKNNGCGISLTVYCSDGRQEMYVIVDKKFEEELEDIVEKIGSIVA